ncbi:MAG TPA: hypothetical protein VLL05_22540, partial [Terriglobales bacterium]|nr:hypothetical protein [Terriglobales bacterium]
MHAARLIVPTEFRVEDQEDQRKQEKQAPRRGELLEHCPEKLLSDVPRLTHGPIDLLVRPVKILGVQAIANPRLLFELRPKFVELQPFGYAQPEAMQLFAKGERGNWAGSDRWWIRGGHKSKR